MKTKRSRSASEAKTRVQSLISKAEHFEMSSASIQAEYLSLKDEFNLPHYEWRYLLGYLDANRDRWYRNNFVYCTVFPDGMILSANWDSLPEERKEYIRTHPSVISGHFWRKQSGEIGLCFFASEDKEIVTEIIRAEQKKKIS